MIDTVCGYTIGDVIAEGSQGVVSAATHGLTSRKAVVKVVPFTNNQRKMRNFENEVSLTDLLQGHDNIISLFGSQRSAQMGAMVLERADSDLLDIVSNGPLEPTKARKIFRDICAGLHHCHMAGVAHRDLKPENIMLCDGVAKLADFGAAFDTAEFGMIGFDRVGTEMYAAPEVLSAATNPSGYNCFAADIWSAGIVLHVLITGCWPYVDTQDVQYGLVNIEERFFQRECLDLIRSMLAVNPAKRVTIEEVLQHPFLQSHPQTSAVESLKAAPRSHSVDYTATKKPSLFKAAKKRLSSANRGTRLKVLTVVSSVLPSGVSKRMAA